MNAGARQLRDLIELADRRFLVDAAEDQARHEQRAEAGAPPKRRGVGRVLEFGVIEVVGRVAADVLLRGEARRAQRLGVIGIDSGKELADERQRADVATPGLRAARRIPAHEQARLPPAKYPE